MKIIIFFNPLKIEENYIEDTILPIFQKFDIEVLKIISAGSGIVDGSANEADYYVVLGGDGTVLRIAEMSAEYSKPIIGINLGNLGFMTTYSVDEFEEAAKDISQNNLVFSERNVLECFLGGKKYMALNDIVLQKSQPLGTVDIEVKVGKNILYSFLGDGIIISTATGSTGYALSAGGSVVDSSLNVIELIPLSPHALNIRPFILSPTKYVEVLIKSIDSGFAYVTGDGDILHRLETGMSVIITGSDKKVKLAQRNNDNFFDLLNRKLAFGRRFE
jgi:NAD+ kinase